MPPARGSALAGAYRAPLIIAEAANNHGGDVERAIELARAAKRAGVDVVKFQIGISELCGPTSPLAAEFRRLELPLSTWNQVREECRKIGVGWTASVWSQAAAEYLAGTDAPFVKIGSGDLTYAPTLRAAVRTGKPLVLSTGLATEEEIRDALATLRSDPLRRPGTRVTLLACTVDYPCLTAEAHLARLQTLDRLAETESIVDSVGYSSHCADWRVPAYAARMGASVVEAHLGLAGEKDGSLGPEGFASMVAVARGIVTPPWDDVFALEAWGRPELGIHDCELPWVGVARRDPATGVRT